MWFYTTNLPSLCPELGMLVISTTPSFEASLQKEQPRGLTGGVQPSSVPPGPPGFLVLVSRLGALSAPWGGLCRCLGNRPPPPVHPPALPKPEEAGGKSLSKADKQVFPVSPQCQRTLPHWEFREENPTHTHLLPQMPRIE